MLDTEEDAALRSANQSLSGRTRREASRITALELRSSDLGSNPWELLTITCVASVALLAILVIWLL